MWGEAAPPEGQGLLIFASPCLRRGSTWDCCQVMGEAQGGAVGERLCWEVIKQGSQGNLSHEETLTEACACHEVTQEERKTALCFIP